MTDTEQLHQIATAWAYTTGCSAPIAATMTMAQGVLALLDMRSELERQIIELRHELSAMHEARDEACDLAVEIGSVPKIEDQPTGWPTRIAKLREVGSP